MLEAVGVGGVRRKRSLKTEQKTEGRVSISTGRERRLRRALSTTESRARSDELASAPTGNPQTGVTRTVTPTGLVTP